MGGEELEHLVVRQRVPDATLATDDLRCGPERVQHGLLGRVDGGLEDVVQRKLATGRAVYVGYNAVVPPSPAFVRGLERLVRSPKVRRVIVDVRLNAGGDNTTYGSLTSLLDSPAVDKRGKLYVLIGRATFSAAANFAAEFDRDTRATFAGEPTGGGVETYGDTVPVLLPTVG